MILLLKALSEDEMVIGLELEKQSKANLTEVNLKNAWLLDAILLGTNIAKADFNNVKLGDTSFVCVDFSQTKNLETCEHLGPSYIDYQTMMRSKSIPKEFLKGIGLQSLFIEYLYSFQSEPWQFYSCFIAYSEKDKVFSKKLYNSLRRKRIMCWRWRENAPWSGKIREEIDRAIFNYDKLLITCSENSLKSPQVIREIERAIQKEDELRKQNPKAKVLFPISIDNYLFDEWDHYLKNYLLEYFVGDFRAWHKPQKYATALDRLVTNLKRESDSRSLR